MEEQQQKEQQMSEQENDQGHEQDVDEQAQESEVVNEDQDQQDEAQTAEVEESEAAEMKEETHDPEALLKEIEQLKAEKQQIYDRMIRLQAEFDNFKKRTQRERIAERKYQAQDLVTELLPALDNFERALQVEVTDATKSIMEGITMVYNQIKEALKSQGVEEIKTVGQEFDPNLHHAVMQVEEEDKQSNEIVEELQKGYLLKDRVIRPAMVKVNK